MTGFGGSVQLCGRLLTNEGSRGCSEIGVAGLCTGSGTSERGIVRRAMLLTAWSLLPVFVIITAVGAVRGEESLRIDQLQLLGTHNSYHIAPDAFTMSAIAAVAGGEAAAIDYTRRPLAEQFEQLSVRHIELDCYLDPEGKLYRHPLAITMGKVAGAGMPPFDPEGRLATPGIKILHSPDFDVRTTNYTLRDALTEVKTWSYAHAWHVPIFVLLELKSDSFSGSRPLPWLADSFTALHQEIRDVWPRDRILAPRDVQGEAATLRDAVAGKGWPAVEDHLGKVAFLLDNEGADRDRYLEATDRERLLFVSVSREHPEAAWMKRNDPVAAEEEICELVQSGFLVRTRADAGTREARENATRRRDVAIATGAQLISTDYPEPDLRLSNYAVELPPPPEGR